jgi:hypothetical protein
MNDQIPGMTYRAPTAIGNNEESQGGEKMVVALQTRADVKPEREELYRLFEQGDLVPVYRTLLADLETPVSVYLKLALDGKSSFLLESVEGGEQVGR